MDLEDEISCPVCTDIYKDPVILSCTHSICKGCLKKFWETKGYRECPICRRSSRSDPPLNLVLKNLCEKFVEGKSQRGPKPEIPQKVVLSVCLCVFACVVYFMCPSSKHPRNQQFNAIAELEAVDHKEETIMNLDPLEEKLKAYEEAKLTFQEKANHIKEELKIMLKGFKKKLTIFEEAKVTSEQTAEHIKTQAQHTEELINKEFQKLHQFLQDEEAARIAALREEEEQKSQMMKEKIEKMSTEISSLSDAVTAIEEMGPDGVTFLQTYKSTLERAQCTPQNPERVSGALINVAKHLGNLKFRVWEKMQEMVQYTPVTLDPNSAHPGLFLSKDLTSVTEGEEAVQQLPDNPERFDEYLSLLGSEGFDSGTHCWDVEVGDNTLWNLGVMAESLQRKGKYDSMSGEFYIWYNDGAYGVHSPPHSPTILTVTQKPQRIRVQLDWDRGELTFSDSDTKEHLYSLRHRFTERVFPYFNGCRVFPLRIAPVKVSVVVEELS